MYQIFLEVSEIHRGILDYPQVADTLVGGPRSTPNTHITFKQFSHGLSPHNINSFHIHIIE